MFKRTFFWLFFVALAACGSPPESIELTGQTMGTTYRIVVTNDGAALDREQLHAAIETTLEDVNAKYSNWDANSEISNFNALNTLEFVEISSGFQQMLDIAERVHIATNGAFDVTITPIINLWGFGQSGTVTQRPSADEIALAKENVGQTRVIERSPSGDRLRKINAEATVSLTAIAKGYGIDAVASALSDLGATDYMVEIGGDLYVSGQTHRGSDWLIGIERPIPGQKTVQEILELSNVGMATSGDYRNYFEENGVRYSHIIDAVSGQPISHRTASVTVIAETTAEADAWATALLAVGVEDGLRIADAYDLNVLFIAKTNSDNEAPFEMIATDGIAKFKPSIKE